MNYRFLLISLFLFASFFAGSQAFVADQSNKRLLTPMPPAKGRQSEANFYSLLHNSGREYLSWIKEGRAYLSRRDYEQAIWAFRKAVRLQPAAEEARFLLACAYERRGLEGLPGDNTNWDALAAREYIAAIELADHLPARFNLAILHRRHERFIEARRELEHIILLDNKTSLAQRARRELAALFAQDMLPRSLTTHLQGQP